MPDRGLRAPVCHGSGEGAGAGHAAGVDYHGRGRGMTPERQKEIHGRLEQLLLDLGRRLYRSGRKSDKFSILVHEADETGCYAQVPLDGEVDPPKVFDKNHRRLDSSLPLIITAGISADNVHSAWSIARSEMIGDTVIVEATGGGQGVIALTVFTIRNCLSNPQLVERATRYMAFTPGGHRIFGKTERGVQAALTRWRNVMVTGRFELSMIVGSERGGGAPTAWVIDNLSINRVDSSGIPVIDVAASSIEEGRVTHYTKFQCARAEPDRWVRLWAGFKWKPLEERLSKYIEKPAPVLAVVEPPPYIAPEDEDAIGSGFF
jgi:hypothetical protein